MKCYEVLIGIKRWFNELFDGNLVEESMVEFRVLIGKRKGLIWVVRKKKKRDCYGVWLYEHYLKKEIEEPKRPMCLSALNIQ